MGLKRMTVLYLFTGLITGGACLIVQGPLPGDVAVTRLLQSVLGCTKSWAEFLTESAKLPGLWATLGVAVIVASLNRNWRIACTPVIALIFVQLLDVCLRAMLFAPRPTSDLVIVAVLSKSSGLPSTFGLVYGALFGISLCAANKRSSLSIVAATLSMLLILVGSSARIALGGHWTSQIIASILVGISFAAGGNLALNAIFNRYCPERHAGYNSQ